MKNAIWENWVNVALGVWLILSPWIITHNLGASSNALTEWNYWIIGTLITISAAFALQDLKPWEEWVNLVLGIWMLLSPWTLGYSMEKNLLWNSTICGLAIAVFSGIAIPIANKLQVQRH